MIRFRIAAQILTAAEIAAIKRSRTPITINAQSISLNELIEEQWGALQEAMKVQDVVETEPYDLPSA